MSDKEDKERFRNLITTGSYATDEELGSFMGISIVVALIVGLIYGIYHLLTK